MFALFLLPTIASVMLLFVFRSFLKLSKEERSRNSPFLMFVISWALPCYVIPLSAVLWKWMGVGS